MRFSLKRWMTLCGTLLLVAGLSAGCGNGGGSGGVMPSTCISFQPSAAPAPSTASARQGSGSSCDMVVVEVTLTGVNDVFAVSFDVNFDPTLGRYEGHSLAGSRLTSDGAQVIPLEDDSQPGKVSLGLTRQNPSTGIDFVGTQSVVRLMFSKALASGSRDANLSFSNTKVFGSEQPPVEKPGIQWFGGSLQVK